MYWRTARDLRNEIHPSPGPRPTHASRRCMQATDAVLLFLTPTRHAGRGKSRNRRAARRSESGIESEYVCNLNVERCFSSFAHGQGEVTLLYFTGGCPLPSRRMSALTTTSSIVLPRRDEYIHTLQGPAVNVVSSQGIKGA